MKDQLKLYLGVGVGVGGGSQECMGKLVHICTAHLTRLTLQSLLIVSTGCLFCLLAVGKMLEMTGTVARHL